MAVTAETKPRQVAIEADAGFDQPAARRRQITGDPAAASRQHVRATDAQEESKEPRLPPECWYG